MQIRAKVVVFVYRL